MSDPSLPYLFAGFAIVVVALGAYLLRLGISQRRLEERLDSIERRGTVERHGDEGG